MDASRSSENQRDHADLALVVYLEDLLRDRRVLLVGDTSPRVERRLSDAARTVDVVSRDRRPRRRGLPLRAWPTPSEKGTWDAIVIPDLVAAGLADPARFDEIASLVADGILVAAIDANGSEPGYEAFHALVSARFEGHRVLGQAPLNGFALAELGATTSDVAYDASSAELAPARFVAVAAPRALSIDGYAVIATPRAAPEPAASPAPDPRYEQQVEAARTRLEHAEKRLEQAQREIARNAQKLDEARHEQARLEEALRARQAEAEDEDDRESEAVRAARDECVAIEARLRTAAREMTALRLENERRGVLVRDLVEEMRTGVRAGGGAGPASSDVDAELGRAQEALRTAQRRAVEAEARRAELAFRVDELTADLASVGQAHEARTAKLVAEHAAAQGAARGLLAKVGELTELRTVAESRLALVEDDVLRSRDRGRELERKLAELEEQLELARIAKPAPRSAADADPGREGQLFGALLKAREELADLQQERLALVGEIARLRAALEIVAHETDAGVREARRRASALEAEATVRAHQLDDRNNELANVRGERDELANRVVALESVLPPPPASIEDTAKIDLLERELDALRGECAGLRLRADDADAAVATAFATARALEARIGASEAASRTDARRAADFASRLAARDALVSRLQSDLGHAAERHGAAERTSAALEMRLAAASESIGALEAVSSVRSDEEKRERDAIATDLTIERARAGRLETERASALEALRDVRESLTRLAGGLTASESRAASIPTAPEGIWREEIARLARDVDDRELMLRSLTAQLEERDDRIRALERVSKGEGGAPDPAKLLEAEERIARLTAELAEAKRVRERAEASASSVGREADLRRLEQLVGDRDAQLMLLEGRIEGAGREERAMRDAFAETRASLETILAHLGGDRGGEAAEKAAELLQSLRRY